MTTALGALQLLLLGLLAGEELVVRYGVQPALSSLPDADSIRARVALVRRLKAFVPAIMLPATVASVALVVVTGADGAAGWRYAGLASLTAFLVFSFLGTVPINMRVNDWTAETAPSDWRDTVRRWQDLDVARSTAAIVAFALFLVAAALAFP